MADNTIVDGNHDSVIKETTGELQTIRGRASEWLVGVGRIELPTSCSQSRRPTAGLHPGSKEKNREEAKVVPPERVELSSPAPEAGTLSTELQGHVN